MCPQNTGSHSRNQRNYPVLLVSRTRDMPRAASLTINRRAVAVPPWMQE